WQTVAHITALPSREPIAKCLCIFRPYPTYWFVTLTAWETHINPVIRLVIPPLNPHLVQKELVLRTRDVLQIDRHSLLVIQQVEVLQALGEFALRRQTAQVRIWIF